VRRFALLGVVNRRSAGGEVHISPSDIEAANHGAFASDHHTTHDSPSNVILVAPNIGFPRMESSLPIRRRTSEIDQMPVLLRVYRSSHLGCLY
jgi:hypothetical protein